MTEMDAPRAGLLNEHACVETVIALDDHRFGVRVGRDLVDPAREANHHWFVIAGCDSLGFDEQLAHFIVVEKMPVEACFEPDNLCLSCDM
jgi:hypothetical protein